MVDTVRYTNSNNDMVQVEPEGWGVSWPSQTWHKAVIEEWVAEGNSILPYDEFYGVSLNEVKEIKYTEVYDYADGLIEYQENLFFPQGSKVSRNKERLQGRQNSRNTKKINGQPLTPQEELDDDKYDYLMDWSDKVYDAADLAEDDVELLVDAASVQAYDVTAQPSWPVWSPPV